VVLADIPAAHPGLAARGRWAGGLGARRRNPRAVAAV